MSKRPYLKLDGEYIYVYNGLDIRSDLKSKAFKYDAFSKAWYTKLPQVLRDIESLEQFLEKLDVDTQDLKEYIKRLKDKRLQIDIPAKPGMSYFDYQKEFVSFAKNKKAVLLADEMGLGKTVQAIALMNYKPPQKAIIFCPAFLKENWKKELKKWLVHDIPIKVLNSSNIEELSNEKGIFIINYDLAEKIPDNLRKGFDLAVYDESHYIKNPEAKRTFYSLRIDAKNTLFLTGTPILNRVTELVPLIMKINNPDIYFKDHKDFKKEAKRLYWDIAYKYCEISEDRFGKKVEGVKRPESFKRDYLEGVMIRRLKDEVLKQLPEKIRVPIVLNSDSIRDLLQKEYMILSSKTRISQSVIQEERDEEKLTLENLDKEIKRLKKSVEGRNDATALPVVRHLLGLMKVKDTIAYSLNLLEEDKNRLVIMTWHKDVAKLIAEGLESAGARVFLNTSETSMAERNRAVEIFQSDDKEPTIFIGTIKASGVGLTLTKAQDMVFAELSYVPADIFQAEDRIHRIGQERPPNYHYMLHADSVDFDIVSAISRKQSDIDSILASSESLLANLIQEEKESKDKEDIQNISPSL